MTLRPRRVASVPAVPAARDAVLPASFAAAVLLHHAWWTGFAVFDRRLLVVAAALWCLARPASVGRFALLLGVVVAHVALALPDVGDHMVLVAVVGASVLGVLGQHALRDRRLPGVAELSEVIAPLLRGAVVVVYAAAALAKLNTDFLDPSTSFAVSMARDGFGWAPGAVVWATPAVELALALLLLVPRGRTAGLLLGAGFHVTLALAGNVPFAAVALACYAAFLPTCELPAPRVPFAAGATAWLGLALIAPSPAVAGGVTGVLARLAIVAWAVALALMALRLRARAAPSPRRLHPALAAGLAVLILNAATPYAGLDNPGTFTMYSNLHTGGEGWNHILVPDAARVLSG